MGQTNEKLNEKVASDAIFQSVKTVQDPIDYLMILNNFFLSHQYEQHFIRCLCLATRRLYNTVHKDNKNMTDYLVISRNS